jgi:hypothetical protein
MATSALPLASFTTNAVVISSGVHPPFVLLQTRSIASSDVAEQHGRQRVTGGDGHFCQAPFTAASP